MCEGLKKIVLFMLLFVGLWVIPGLSHADGGQAKIYLNDKQLGTTGDTKVEIINKSVMIPIRMVAEELGYGVKWEQKTGTVTIEQNGSTIKMVVNNKNATVDNQSVKLDNAPVLRKGTTLVPLRFIGEQFGMKVKWNNTTKTVYLEDESGSGAGSQPPAGSPTTPSEGESSTVTNPSGLTEISGLSFSENRLLIATSGKVTPKVFTMTGPDRIVIDLPDTKFSSTYGQDLNQQGAGTLEVTDYPVVSKVRYSLFSDKPSTVRIVIDLTQSSGYHVTQEGTSLLVLDLNSDSTSTPSTENPGTTPVIPPNTTNPDENNGNKVIVLDAGHGDHDSGAVGVTGKLEKDLNLSLILKVEALLKKESGVDVILTRDDDTFVSLTGRAKVANDLGADVFISIHANSAGSSASGTETFYYKNQDKALATIVHKHLVSATGFKDRKVKSGNLSVLRNTKMPAALLEIGFLSNKTEEAAMFKEDFQNRVAQGIVDGIKEYLNL